MKILIVKNLCLIFNNVDGYITGCNSIDESNGFQYLMFASTKDNKKVFKKYTNIWDDIKWQTN